MNKRTQIILGSVLALVVISVIASAALSNYRVNRIEAILNPQPSASVEVGVVNLDKMVVTILNGTNREGLSTRLGSRLETFGVFVTSTTLAIFPQGVEISWVKSFILRLSTSRIYLFWERFRKVITSNYSGKFICFKGWIRS